MAQRRDPEFDQILIRELRERFAGDIILDERRAVLAEIQAREPLLDVEAGRRGIVWELIAHSSSLTVKVTFSIPATASVSRTSMVRAYFASGSLTIVTSVGDFAASLACLSRISVPRSCI